jgi:hypothetical protein
MIRVQTIGLSDIRIQPRSNIYDVGNGVTVYENSASAPTPGVSNGILLESSSDFLMLEDNVSYLLQEA